MYHTIIIILFAIRQLQVIPQILYDIVILSENLVDSSAINCRMADKVLRIRLAFMGVVHHAPRSTMKDCYFSPNVKELDQGAT